MIKETEIKKAIKRIIDDLEPEKIIYGETPEFEEIEGEIYHEVDGDKLIEEEIKKLSGNMKNSEDSPYYETWLEKAEKSYEAAVTDAANIAEKEIEIKMKAMKKEAISFMKNLKRKYR